MSELVIFRPYLEKGGPGSELFDLLLVNIALRVLASIFSSHDYHKYLPNHELIPSEKIEEVKVEKHRSKGRIRK